MPFEEVDYWNELTEIMDWTEKSCDFHDLSLLGSAGQSLSFLWPGEKTALDKKMFGLFQHRVLNRKIPLVRGFDDVFLAPHSRHTEVPIADIHACKDLTVLAES